MTKTFEGTALCNSTTPIGQSIACPHKIIPIKTQPHCSQHCNPDSDHCRVVYVGHNFLGNEMHWLPKPYLKRWWSDTPWSMLNISSVGRNISSWFDTLQERTIWCDAWNDVRPDNDLQYSMMYNDCSLPIQSKIDRHAIDIFRLNRSESISWSPIYASLPLIRTTMIRDPFSWLVSKLFWHEIEKQHGIKCDNIEELRIWYKTFAMDFIVSICGEDCYVRWAYNISSLSDLMDQAEDNLRQSFAVIGLLNETENFYKMVSRRVHYMDTSRNMPQFRMKRHKSIRSPDFMFCKDLYQSSSFQRDVSLASPEVRAMIHLYDVAVQVNRFQADELEKCGS
mmetsp:Transcript_7921/g.9917  ORF Transcript_7921/g.9917 Transcript_7921/m.9917 type:complete len:337 (-) Transcript_7921:105-1115(-)